MSNGEEMLIECKQLVWYQILGLQWEISQPSVGETAAEWCIRLHPAGQELASSYENMYACFRGAEQQSSCHNFCDVLATFSVQTICMSVMNY